MIANAPNTMNLAFLSFQPIFAHGFTSGEVRLLYVLFYGPYILAGLLLIAAVAVCFWSRWAAAVCFFLAALSCLVGFSIRWNDQRPARERHARWAAEVAADPTVLHGSNIGDDDLELLRNTTRLSELNLDSCYIRAKGLQCLGELRCLKSLSLQGALGQSDSDLTADSLVSLEGLSQLEELNISCNDSVTDAVLEHLRQFARLRTLNLHLTRITNVGLDCLKGMTELRDLNLGFTGITGSGLEKLKGLDKLEKLDLESVPNLTADDIDHLKALPCLHTLSIEDVTLTDAGLARVAEIKQLKELCLGRTKTTDAGLALLEPLHQLEELDIWSTEITDAGVVHLKVLTSLKGLDLSYNRITDEGLRHLQELPQLETLSLMRTKVTDIGLAHLNTLTHLKSLSLDQTLVTEESVRKLRQTLPNCKISYFR
jgi:internalin A